jgi:DNA polymerase III subunit epsilon
LRLFRSRRGAAVDYARASVSPTDLPWRQASWCAVDLELTGLNPRKDRIISIGAVPIEGGRVLLGKGLYTLVRTTKRSEVGALLVHKLRAPDLIDAPPIDQALDALFGVLAGRVPVFHTAAVEQAFLSKLFARRGVQLPAAADTEVLGRLWRLRRAGSAPPSLALAKLSTELGIAPEVPHHALADALTTAQAFVALATHLDIDETQTVGTLVAAGDQFSLLRRI